MPTPYSFFCSSHPSRLLGRIIFCLAVATAVSAVQASCIWYADDDTIRQVDTDTNQIVASVRLAAPHRLVMNASDCGVWVLHKNDRKLLRFNEQGSLTQEIRARDIDRRFGDIDRVRLDPYDNSLWLTDERRIAHIAANGQLIGTSFQAPEAIRRIRVGLDQSLWVLGKRRLWNYSAAGVLKAEYPLNRHLSADANYFALDSLNGVVWLAGDREIAQFRINDFSAPPLRITTAQDISGFASNPRTGQIWVAQRNALTAYNLDGTLGYQTNLAQLNLRNPEKLAFDPVSRSLWAGFERRVARFTETGQFVTSLAARDGDEALGAPAFRIDPKLTLIRPPESALTNQPSPSFELAYDVQCNGQDCGFTADYLKRYVARYALTARLNNQNIASGFTRDANTGHVFYTPPVRLLEGANPFIAQAIDPFGHGSNTINTVITVDTIAPRFLTLNPPDGAVLQTPAATVSGTIDDPTAVVVLNGSGSNQSGSGFSFPVTLLPGPNIYALSAIDRAGNVGNAAVRLTLATGVSLSLASPAAGASIADDQVTVSGAVYGPSNIGVTVNGVVAAINGTTFNAVNVPLQPGSNTLTIKAMAPNGDTATQTRTVTSSGAAPLKMTASPQSGIAPLQTVFTLSNSGNVGITRIEADFNGDGVIDQTITDPSQSLAFSYATPGVYQAKFNIVDSINRTTSQTTVVVAQDGNQVDRQLKQIWSGFAGALGRNDKAGALSFLNAQAQTKYGPVFDALQSQMPQIASGFSDVQTVDIGAAFSTYAVNRMVEGVNRIFIIQFLIGSDGVWRLDSM